MHGTVTSIAPPAPKTRTITLTHRAPVKIVEVAIRVRSKVVEKGHCPHYLVHANYKHTTDWWDPEDGDNMENQMVRVGREIHEHDPDLYANIVAVGEELCARILNQKMHINVTLVVDACFASLPARRVI